MDLSTIIIDKKVTLMTTIITFLKGKKTYIVGILMIALGFLNGDNQLILEGFGFITLRAGVADVSEKI